LPLDCQLEAWSYFVLTEGKLVLEADNSAKLQPLFFEWQDYEIIITAQEDTNLEFYHSNQQLGFFNDIGWECLNLKDYLL
jgi:hypothetical protein